MAAYVGSSPRLLFRSTSEAPFWALALHNRVDRPLLGRRVKSSAHEMKALGYPVHKPWLARILRLVRAREALEE
jgi:hypothetical protein